jgi:WD40 repeat protein
MVASGGEDNRVRVWTFPAGDEITVLEEYSDYLFEVEFSPDGRYLASACQNHNVYVHDVQTWTRVALLEGHTASAMACSWHPSGRYLVTGADDNTIRIWEIPSGECLFRGEGHSDDVWSAKFSPDGRFVISGGEDNAVKIWGPELPGVAARAAFGQFSPAAPAFLGARPAFPSSTFGALGGGPSMGSSIGTPIQVGQSPSVMPGTAGSAHVAPVSTSLLPPANAAAFPANSFWAMARSQAVPFSAPTAVKIRRHWVSTVPETARIPCWAPGDARVLYVDGSRVEVLESLGGTPVSSLPDPGASVYALAFGIQAVAACLGTSDGRVLLWAPHQGDQFAPILQGNAPVVWLQYSDVQNGMRAYLANGQFYQRNVVTGEGIEHSLPAPPTRGQLISCSPMLTHVAVARGSTITISDLTAGLAEVAVIELPSDVTLVEYLERGTVLGVVAGGGTVRLYYTRTYELMAEVAYGCDVTALSFHPFAPAFAIGAADGTFSIHELRKGRLRKRETRESPVRALRWSPTGQNLLVLLEGGHLELDVVLGLGDS